MIPQHTKTKELNVKHENYKVVPSTSPLSKRQAYKLACERYNVESAEAREALTESGCIGIAFESNRGVEVFAKWSELPKTKKP